MQKKEDRPTVWTISLADNSSASAIAISLIRFRPAGRVSAEWLLSSVRPQRAISVALLPVVHFGLVHLAQRHVAMIIGMLPMALGLGEGGEQNAPQGRAVIGGLTVATFTTLFFVPIVCTYLRKKAPVDQDRQIEDEQHELEEQDHPI